MPEFERRERPASVAIVLEACCCLEEASPPDLRAALGYSWLTDIAVLLSIVKWYVQL
jgi:hypothetical protein